MFGGKMNPILKSTLIFLIQAIVVSGLTVLFGAEAFLYFREAKGEMHWECRCDFEPNIFPGE